MFNTVRKLAKIKKLVKDSGKKETDENGKSVLRLNCSDDASFLSPYSSEKESVISSEVADFLDNEAQSLNLKRNVHIVISGKTIDENERKIYPEAIKKYYGNRIIETGERLKKNLIAAIVMAVIAAAILSLCVAINLSDKDFVLSELVDIAAWVFAWEAVDMLFLTRPLLRREQLLNCRLYEAEVTYA